MSYFRLCPNQITSEKQDILQNERMDKKVVETVTYEDGGGTVCRTEDEAGAGCGELTWLAAELECPVCLLVPRCSPVLQCRVGHVVCHECQPRLRRCPVCQARYTAPPTRSFLAERLLPRLSRACRHDTDGCKFRSSECANLVAHEADCSHRPAAPAAAAAGVGSGQPRPLLLLLAACLLLAGLSPGPLLARAAAALLFRTFWRPHCPAALHSQLYWAWPDTFLPASQEGAVWRPRLSSVTAGRYSLHWSRAGDLYWDGVEKRWGDTRLVHPGLTGLARWKLDLAGLPTDCRVKSVVVSGTGGEEVRRWDSDLLATTTELLVLTGVTQPQQDCPALPDSLTFTVAFLPGCGQQI